MTRLSGSAGIRVMDGLPDCHLYHFSKQASQLKDCVAVRASVSCRVLLSTNKVQSAALRFTSIWFTVNGVADVLVALGDLRVGNINEIGTFLSVRPDLRWFVMFHYPGSSFVSSSPSVTGKRSAYCSRQRQLPLAANLYLGQQPALLRFSIECFHLTHQQALLLARSSKVLPPCF